MNTIGMIILLLFLMIHQTPARSVTHVNWGVIFKENSVMNNAEMLWKHTFQVQLPKLTIENSYIKTPIANSSSQMNEIMTKIQILRNDTANNLESLKSKINMLVPEASLNDINRNQRALLPFIGSLSKSLFGTASASDIQLLQDHINELIKDQNTLKNNFQEHTTDMTSYMKTVNDRVDTALKGIQLNHDELNNYLHTMTISSSENTEMIYKLMTIMTSEILSANTIIKATENIMLAIHDLMQNKLPPVLISVDTLNMTLENVQKVLQSKYHGFSIATYDTKYYYSISNIMFTRREDSIFITVNIPITKSTVQYHVYEIQTFPIPIHNTTKHVSQILNYPKYIAIDSKRETYLELDEFEYAKCLGEFQKHCPNIIPQRQISSPNCLIAILLNDHTMTMKLCDFRFIENGLQTFIMELDSNRFLLSNITTLTIACSGKSVQTKQGCQFCIIESIGCDCLIKADNFHFPSRISTCNNNFNSITKVYPVNLAILNYFFSSTEIQNILGDSSYSDPFYIENFPKIKIYESKYKNLVAKDQIDHLSLEKVTKRIKENLPIYKSNMHQFIDSPIANINYFGFDWKTIGLVTSLLCNLIWLILILMILYKYKKLAIAVSVLTGTHKSTAIQTLPPLVWSSTTTHFSFVEQCYGNIFDLSFIFSMMVIVPILLLVVLVHLYRRSKKKNITNVYIEFSNSQQCTRIKLMKFKSCSRFWQLIGSQNVGDISISRVALWHYIQINYHDMKMKHIVSKEEFLFPRNILVLNLFRIRKLKSILKSTFYTSILFEHQNTVEYLNNFEEMQNECSILHPNV